MPSSATVGAQGCITVELRIPERKHGMAQSESGQKRKKRSKNEWMDGRMDGRSGTQDADELEEK